ncbi:protein C3orf33 homolog [Xyrichtys novacula]|uniref:Protein C3orf33 homolog n=1 Tax=Xyrichtys novacula TaxID=13765 RepID=A0AAV1FVP1_XYRNO|nr:protein C3orf33 homolog [Xyrichtys novacula]
MPAESLQGIETEEEAEGDRQQREQGNQTSHNIVSLISQLADDNLTLVRNLSTALAIAGVVVIARSIRLITKFRAASRGTSAFVGKFVVSQSEGWKWNMSRFISRSSHRYFQTIKVYTRLRCWCILQEWS